jgi:hypothetical protein
MSVNTYKIERWDAILFDNSTNPTPIIYIKPDKELLDFAKQNKNAVLINIVGSNSIYDNKNIPSIFTKSSKVPNCRNNFFKKTGLYVIILDSDWHGYPDCLGECKIYGLGGGKKSDKVLRKIPLNTVDHSDKEKEKSIPKKHNKHNKHHNKDYSRLIYILILFIVFLTIIIFLINK